MSETLQDRVIRQRRRRRKRIITVVILLCIFIATTCAAYYWFDSKFFGNRNRAEEGLMVAEDKVNIMVMGVDRREDDVGRSDTLFVATVDPGKKAAAILSIPRDTRVKIAGHGYDKINHAYAYGGHKLTKDTVEGLLGIPIDYYVLIDTKAFERIIDAIGGIDIDVEKRMYYEDPWDDDGGLVIDLRPGMQHMDGKTAITYVRYRDEEGDIGRIARQQKFLRAVMDKVASPSIIPKIPSIIQEVSAAIETDMSISKMVSLAGILKEAKEKGLNADMVPGKPAYIEDISYWLPDVVKLRQSLATILDVKMDDRVAKAMQQEAVEYETSIPKEMKIVDEPKSLPLGDKDKETDKLKDKNKDKKDATDTAKKADIDKKSGANKESEQKKTRSLTIHVEVVNASGIDGAGSEVASILRNQGFTVTGVSNMTAPYKKTVVITNTSDSSVVGKFAALPFNYSIQVNPEESTENFATVVIGKDYGS